MSADHDDPGVTAPDLLARLDALRADAAPARVPMGMLFALAKELLDLPPTEIEVVLDEPDHDARVTAVSVMDWQARRRRTSEQRGRELYELYRRRHDRIDTWDLIDRAAPHVVGGYLIDRARDPSTSWRGHRAGSNGGPRSSLPGSSSAATRSTTPSPSQPFSPTTRSSWSRRPSAVGCARPVSVTSRACTASSTSTRRPLPDPRCATPSSTSIPTSSSTTWECGQSRDTDPRDRSTAISVRSSDPADGQVAVGFLLEPDRLVDRVGAAHEPAPGRDRLQRVGEHDPRRRGVLAGELRLHLAPVALVGIRDSHDPCGTYCS